jgi:hypothetical protein
MEKKDLLLKIKNEIIDHINCILNLIPTLNFKVKGINTILPFDLKDDIKILLPPALLKIKEILSQKSIDSFELSYYLSNNFTL